MDKYARNYLAEGIKNKDDIIVTPESEIYKSLNQHYNRNNHIQVNQHQLVFTLTLLSKPGNENKNMFSDGFKLYAKCLLNSFSL